MWYKDEKEDKTKKIGSNTNRAIVRNGCLNKRKKKLQFD